MANVVKAKIMKNHQTPVVLFKLIFDMPCHIIVDFCKVLLGYM